MALEMATWGDRLPAFFFLLPGFRGLYVPWFWILRR